MPSIALFFSTFAHEKEITDKLASSLGLDVVNDVAILHEVNINMSPFTLVDDEREYVQTLSERLVNRNVGSYAVFDGRKALDFIDGDKPDVMVLDLKMPGINGIEVLSKTKKANPNIEVIILTGHGSEADRKTCMELGAFAYLQKPADIENLSETINDAYKKIAVRDANVMGHHGSSMT